MGAKWYVEFWHTVISPRLVSRSTSSLVLRWGFLGRWIECHYFWIDQIQDGGRPPSWKISNEYVSGMGYPSHLHEIERSFARIWERIMREEQSGWSQSKIFFVVFILFISFLQHTRCKTSVERYVWVYGKTGSICCLCACQGLHWRWSLLSRAIGA